MLRVVANIIIHVFSNQFMKSKGILLNNFKVDFIIV